MSDAMPIEQAEFIGTIAGYVDANTNYGTERATEFAFEVWQNRRFIAEFLGKHIRSDVIDELFNKKVFNNNTESLFDLSLKECANDFDYGWDRCYHDFEGIAEQLKEHRNE